MTFEIGIGICIFTLIVSRILNERAIKELSADEKAKLVDAFSSMRAYNLIPLAIIVVGYLLAIKYTGLSHMLLSYTYFIFLIAYIVVSQVYVYRKLIRLNYPPSYLKKYTLSRVISFAGIGILFYILV